MIAAGYWDDAMKKTALAALLATTVALTPWQAVESAEAGDFQHGQRLYSLGDYGGALQIWQALAQQGDARAQYSMAILYLRGRGVPKNKDKAMQWAGRAAEQGYKPGRKLLQKLQKPKAKAEATAKPRQRKARSQMTELERIEASAEDWLLRIEDKIAKNGHLEYGDLHAVRLDGAVQITIPDLVIHGDDGGLLEIGTVQAEIRQDDEYFDDITLTLPDEMRFRQQDGSEGRITIARRLAKLRWDRQLEISTDFEFRLGELRILHAEGGERGSIGEILALSNVHEDSGLWTGPMRLAISQMKISDGKASALLLDKATIELDLRGLDIPAYNDSLLQTGSDSNGMPPLKQILTLASGVGLHTSIKGLAARHPDQGDFRLDQADYGLDLSSQDGKLLNLALTASHHGLSGTGSAAPEAMVPRELDIALALKNVPSETIVNVGVAAVVEVALLGKVSSGPQVFKRLRQDLSAAATVLQLKRTRISAKDYDITMDLTLQADRAAKAGFVGNGELRIKGLDKLLATTGGRDVPPLADLVKKGKRLQGRRGHLFNLAIRPDGFLAVNKDPVLSLAPFDDTAKQ